MKNRPPTAPEYIEKINFEIQRRIQLSDLEEHQKRFMLENLIKPFKDIVEYESQDQSGDNLPDILKFNN